MNVVVKERDEGWAADLTTRLGIDGDYEKQIAAAANTKYSRRRLAAIARLKQQTLFRDRKVAHAHNGEFLKQRLFRCDAELYVS